MTSIYTLSCPITNKVRYVGKTINLKRRYYQHTNLNMQIKTKTHVSNWLVSILIEGQKPILNIIEICDNWQEREIYWIGFYKEKGFDLCNICTGGKGRVGYKLSDERKKQISENQKGKNTWMKGRKMSQETKLKISLYQKKNNPLRKKVINIVTKKIYDSATAAAIDLGLKRTTLVCMLIGQNKNKTNLRYL